MVLAYAYELSIVITKFSSFIYSITLQVHCHFNFIVRIIIFSTPLVLLISSFRIRFLRVNSSMDIFIVWCVTCNFLTDAFITVNVSVLYFYIARTHKLIWMSVLNQSYSLPNLKLFVCSTYMSGYSHRSKFHGHGRYISQQTLFIFLVVC